MNSASMEYRDWWIAPHDGRELELMLEGTKPLAMFHRMQLGPGAEAPDYPLDEVPHEAFAPWVERGRILRREVIDTGWKPGRFRGPWFHSQILFALPAEAWRIDAMLLALSATLDHSSAVGSTFEPGLERLIGYLLGYEKPAVDRFVRYMKCIVRHDEKARPEIYERMLRRARSLAPLGDAETDTRHEGRELELMLSGTKPLAMFPREATKPGAALDLAFRKHVEAGQVLRLDDREWTFVALPEEEWRAPAMLMTLRALAEARPSDRLGLRRLAFYLLGYGIAAVDSFLSSEIIAQRMRLSPS